MNYLCPSCNEPSLAVNGGRVVCASCGDLHARARASAPRRNPSDGVVCPACGAPTLGKTGHRLTCVIAYPRQRKVVRRNPAGHVSKAHSSHPSIADPHGWRRAIKAVEKARGKSERRFTSDGDKSDWGLVMHIYRQQPGAVVTSHHAKRYCLLLARQRATPNTCATQGAFFKTKADVEAAAHGLPTGRYRAHLLYVDEGDNTIVGITGESFDVEVDAG